MPGKNNSLQTRKRRLPQKYYDMARTLDWACSEGGRHYHKTTDTERARITRAVKRLVNRTGFEPDPDIYQDPLVESIRLLTTWDEQGKSDTSSADADKDVRLLAELEHSIDERVRESYRKE